MKNEFEEIANQWTKHEIFYKKLYEEKKKGEDEYRKYLNSLNRQDLQKCWVNVPDLYDPVDVFSEKIPLFSLDGSVAVSKHARYTPASVHAHDYFEIICVMAGTVTHKIEDNPAETLMAGDICILPDHVYHSIETMDDETIVINIMLRKSKFEETFFDVFMGDNFLADFFWNIMRGEKENRSNSYLFFRTGKDPDVRQCIERMCIESYRKEAYYERIIICELQCMFAYLIRRYGEYYVTEKQNGMRLKILQYIKAHYNDCTLESVAQHFNYSPSYLSRMIRQITGESFSELIQRYRLNMARKLLAETNMQIIQISEELGYRSVSYFNHLFKETYHMTPMEYRREKET